MTSFLSSFFNPTRRRFLWPSAALAVFAGVVLFAVGVQGEEEQIDFNREIRPILNTKCISCHGGVKEDAGFSLFSREDALRDTDSGKPAIIPGDPGASEIIRRLTSKDPEVRMPYHAQPLPEEEIAKLKKWVKQGANWADHWAYVKPERPEVPQDPTGWAQNPIDNFIKARLQQEGLQPSAPADKATLLRRLSLDLTGLPPTEQEVQAFLKDTSPKAYEKQVDRLLASPHFGERWAAMWLDLARYADTKGYEKDDIRNVWRFRDYVIKSFNEDKPFDQFTVEQMAGDLLPDPTEEQLIATTYHRLTANNDEGGTDDEEFRVAALIDRVSNTWEVWQGITMSCVQCHSHPYDLIRHEEFYNSLAFFNNTRDEDVPNESPTLVHFNPEDEAKIGQVKGWLQRHLPEQEAKRKAREIEQLLKIGEPKIHPHSYDSLTNAAMIDGKYLAGGHRGIARLKNVNLTGKTRLILSHGGEKEGGWMEVRKGRPDGEVLATLKVGKGTNPWNTGGYQKSILDLKPAQGRHTLYFVFQNPTFQNPQDYVCSIEWVLFSEPLPGEGKPGFEQEVKYPLLSLLNAKAEKTPILQENPQDFRRVSRMFERGDWMSPGKEVTPGTPVSLPSFDRYSKDRLGLAQWLVSPENPLTARVAVNRFWEQLYGTGIVESLEDFGSQGFPPTHPELLDWLSVTFMQEQKWQVKPLLKLLVMSNTYQQSSLVTPELTERDPANLLLARGPRVRLTAEQVRDQTLAVGGLLSRKLHGKSVMPPQPEGVWQVVYSGLQWKTSEGEDAHRRALYTFWRRSVPYPSMMTFDAAGREICISRRIRTNTPLQALVTLNDTVYIMAARGLARQMQQAGAKVEEQVQKGYQLAVFKQPKPQVVQILKDLYAQADQFYLENPEELEKFLGGKEAKEQPDSKQLAALTIVANAIMNLDEFVMKE
jgi:hypothetical protein